MKETEYESIRLPDGEKVIWEPPCEIDEDNHASKLTVNAVRTIKNSLSNGTAVRQLSRDFGVSRATIKAIRDKETWAWMD